MGPGGERQRPSPHPGEPRHASLELQREPPALGPRGRLLLGEPRTRFYFIFFRREKRVLKTFLQQR